ncbi:hypothetical protein PIROE2DRAFT_16935, partial [Piromyces sp. E2]
MYALENSLNITIQLNFIQYDNINKYITDFSPYLLDLNQYLDSDHIEMFDPDIIRDLCSYNDKLIGL